MAIYPISQNDHLTFINDSDTDDETDTEETDTAEEEDDDTCIY